VGIFGPPETLYQGGYFKVRIFRHRPRHFIDIQTRESDAPSIEYSERKKAYFAMSFFKVLENRVVDFILVP
jgi:hypothetical protein